MFSSAIGPGWNISEKGMSVISQNHSITDKTILMKNALNADLKEIGSPVLNKDTIKTQKSEVVLQIQKIRNISAPKSNEDSNAAPRMLLLTLTDGETFVQAIEISNIPFISRDKTAPGSKVLVKNFEIQNGYLCLNKNNIQLLGGKVPHLFEKWELAKSVQHHSRNAATADGPPPWVDFGCKIPTGEKTKDGVKAKEQVKENLEFENSRKDAIAEATTGAVKKVFGGGAKVAQAAPRVENNKTRYEGNKQQNKLRKDTKNVKESLPLQKPSDKVSLFDFLENKLQIAENSKIRKEDDEKYSQKVDTEKREYNNYNTYSSDKNQIPNKQYSNNNEKKDVESQSYVSNQRQNNLVNSYVRKQHSFNKDLDSHKREFGNHSHNNSSHNHPYQKNSSKEKARGYETYNSYKRYNADHTGDRNSSPKKPNAYVEKLPENHVHRKHNSDSLSQQKDNTIGRRNNEEKMNDNWHYRAPTNSGQLVQNQGGDNVENLVENVNKLSIGGEFASRSLRQHLNLQVKKPNVSQNSLDSNKVVVDHNDFTIGNDCLAKYWEDNKFYPARITASTSSTYVVQFKGYGNIEEVLKSDCMPLEQAREERKKYHNRGTLEFRRNTRKFVPS